MGNLHAAKIHNPVSFSRLAANTKVRLFQIRGSAQDEKIGLATDPLKPGPDFDNDSPNSLTRVRDPFN